jgi:hypothetical protein
MRREARASSAGGDARSIAVWAPPLILAAATFVTLWLSNVAYRQVYQPPDDDISALADGLLLLPGAQWQDWFTQGHSHFFDAYPEWSRHRTAFARPAFQALIYAAHFGLGHDWAAYLAINYLAVAAVGAVAFVIAHKALQLSLATATIVSLLVLVSPAVLEASIWELGFASESVAAALIGGAFLALLARRDRLCLALLLVALFTKETVAWAPLAAALSVLLRAGPEQRRERWAKSGAMLAPLALWFGFRIVFYGGVYGTYATAGYTSVADFMVLTSWKLEHFHNLLVQQAVVAAEDVVGMADRVLRVATLGVVLLLTLWWIARSARAVARELAITLRRQRWPEADASMLASIWAALGIGFYFALPLFNSRYAAAATMFAWPAIAAAIEQRARRTATIVLIVCCALSLGRSGKFLAGMNPPPELSEKGQFFHSARTLNAALRAIPPNIDQVYVLFAYGMDIVDPAYLRALLGIRPELIHVADTSWSSTCQGKQEAIRFAHESAGGVVTIRALLPDCAGLLFWNAGIDDSMIVHGRLQRSDRISYELADATGGNVGPNAAADFGRHMTVHIRPRGAARFIIEDRGPGNLTWFDGP